MWRQGLFLLDQRRRAPGGLQLSPRRLGECAKGDGIAMAIQWRDAVLPNRTRGTRHQVSGARFYRKRKSFPGLARLLTKTEVARSQQRNSHDLGELRLVAVPTNAGAGAIFVDQNLLESFRGTVERFADS